VPVGAILVIALGSGEYKIRPYAYISYPVKLRLTPLRVRRGIGYPASLRSATFSQREKGFPSLSHWERDRG